MIDLLRNYFGKGRSATASTTGPDAGHDVRLAACALFLEMALIDGEFSEDEQAKILAILRSKYGLTEELAAALMESARGELKRSLDLWQFAHLINEHYTDEEKVEILELAWRIVYVDGKLDKHEDYLMHKLANLLRVPHKQFIDAKLKALRT
jgi:uncharacterized tellurite resistance protein B-like protein